MVCIELGRDAHCRPCKGGKFMLHKLRKKQVGEELRGPSRNSPGAPGLQTLFWLTGKMCYEQFEKIKFCMERNTYASTQTCFLPAFCVFSATCLCQHARVRVFARVCPTYNRFTCLRCCFIWQMSHWLADQPTSIADICMTLFHQVRVL